jgi:spectinomycin phosphotransferase
MKIELEKIPEIIETEYGISVSGIDQLHIGFDKNTAVYKLFSTDRKVYFLKIRSGNFTETSLTIPFLIYQKTNSSNLINIVKTADGKLYVKRASLYIMIFPFINGQPGWNISLTKDQFVDFGKFMHTIHSTELPSAYSRIIPKETYDSKYREWIKEYIGAIAMEEIRYENPVMIRFLEVFQKRRGIILKILNCAEKMLKEIKPENQKMCLCHGDIHAGNIFIVQNNFYIVDWDTILIAPKERDLMFIGGGIGNKWNTVKEIEYFYYGYGKEAVTNKNLIKYYRCDRILQDIYELYSQIVNAETEEGERELCLEAFKEQFEENNVADIALK